MCKDIRNDKLIVLSDKGRKSKIIFGNKQQDQIEIWMVDGGVIKGNKTLKCDYLVFDVNKKEHYVELKGKDINHAFEQIISTIIRLSKDKKREKHSFIISSRVPKAGTDTQNYKKSLKKAFNSSLIIKNNNYTHKIS